MDLVADLTVVLVSALAGAYLAQRFRQPLIVGYILAGVAVGPFTGGVTVANVENLEQLSELGVVLLLFSLGLEVSFRELRPVRTVALAGGALQIVLTIGLGFGLARAVGWSSVPAAWFGSLVAMSSTMVALKTLQAQGRLGTLSSRVMLGILVLQDLAIVPLTIMLPELSNPQSGFLPVVSAGLRAARTAGGHRAGHDATGAARDGVRGPLELARAVSALDHCHRRGCGVRHPRVRAVAGAWRIRRRARHQRVRGTRTRR